SIRSTGCPLQPDSSRADGAHVTDRTRRRPRRLAEAILGGGRLREAWPRGGRPTRVASGFALGSPGGAASRSLNRDLPLHAHLLVVVDGAVELVLPRRQVQLQRAALAGLHSALQLLVLAVDVLDLERVSRLAVVLLGEGDITGLHGRIRRR